MKKIVEYELSCKDYNVGDVVYLNHKKGKPTCRAEAVKNNDDIWIFRPLSKQSYYSAIGGIIPFGGKPFIFAKEIETEEE